MIGGIQKKAICEGTDDKSKENRRAKPFAKLGLLAMKKRRKAGKKGTKWQRSGMKSKNWRKSWNKEGWKEAPCLHLETMRNVPELVVHGRKSQGIGVKGCKEKKKVSGWSME